MLVLSRKLNETIRIGEGANAIIIEVVDIDRGKVRLGITAPLNVPIVRSELDAQTQEYIMKKYGSDGS